MQDLAGAHAVEVVVEVELLNDGDEAAEVAGAGGGGGAAFGAVALRVPVEEIDRFDEALVRDEIAAEAEVVDEGAALVDGWVEEQPRVLMVRGEEPVGSSATRRDGRAPDRPAGLR